MGMRTVFRRKVTQKWLDEMFAPIRCYLQKHYPLKAEIIVDYLMFMDQYDGKFEYKNSITRDRIVVDKTGNVLFRGASALEYEFEFGVDGEYCSYEDLYIHPNVDRWVHANLKRKDLEAFGEDVRILLQKVIGPKVNFDFTRLRTGDPLRKNKRSLFLYSDEPCHSFVFFFVGKEDYDYWKSQTLLACEGWQTIYVDRTILERQLTTLEQLMEQTIARVEVDLDVDPIGYAGS